MRGLPDDIRPLTSLRFIAAAWVLLHHLRDHLGLDLGRLGLIAHGWLGVDLFFILSGFILAHVNLRQVSAGRFRHATFLRHRLARLYPLHLATLGAMIVLVIGAGAVGAGFPAAAFRWSDLPAHLLLLHAWGATPAVGWNFPSWSISAEWAAYLLFPAFAAMALALRRRPALSAGAWLVACILSYHALSGLHLWPGLSHVGQDFSQMTAQIGALRILPSFGFGVALYVLVRDRPAPDWAGWPLALGGALLVIVTTTYAWPLWLAWPGFAALIAGLAETARRGVDQPLAGPRLLALGAASYALYMLHLPVEIVAFQVLERLGLDAGDPWPVRALGLCAALGACLVVAHHAHRRLEEPARQALRTWRPRWRRRFRQPTVTPGPASPP